MKRACRTSRPSRTRCRRCKGVFVARLDGCPRKHRTLVQRVNNQREPCPGSYVEGDACCGNPNHEHEGHINNGNCEAPRRATGGGSLSENTKRARTERERMAQTVACSTDERRRRLARVCQCGETYAVHGASVPHTRYSEAGEVLCTGFVEAPQPRRGSQ